jgi:non-ribosomal peptide synthetase component F
LSPALQFRREAKRKRTPRFNSARQPVHFDRELVTQIKSFARAQSCTPFMIFVAGLDILLWSYTGESDIRIGTLVANRGQAGTDGLIGYFVNALVLRTRVLPAMTCVELLNDVRETCLGAYAHQDVPFEYLEALLEKKQKRARTPLYQVMFNYRNLWTAPANANGLTIASWNGENRAGNPRLAMARLDVNFNLRELSTELTGAVDYKTDLFEDRRIAKLLVDYSVILKQMITFPKRRISKIAVCRVGKRD